MEKQYCGERLYSSCAQFDMYPVRFRHPVFLNSMPRGGAHLLRNIMMHFFYWDQICHEWITNENLDKSYNSLLNGKYLFCGNVRCGVQSFWHMKNFKLVCMMRDPIDYCISVAKALQSPDLEWWTSLAKEAQEHGLLIDEMISYAIIGEYPLAPLLETYIKYLVQWMDHPEIVVVKFEDLLKHVVGMKSGESESEEYFSTLLRDIGIDLNSVTDWKQRVLAGAEKSLSYSYLAGKDLVGIYDMKQSHHMMMRLLAAGLRTELGYE